MATTDLYVLYEVNPTTGAKRLIEDGLTLEQAQDKLQRWRQQVECRGGNSERERRYCSERYWQFTAKSYR